MRDAQLIPMPASISYDVYNMYTLRLLSSFYIRVSICFSEPVRNHYLVAYEFNPLPHTFYLQ